MSSVRFSHVLFEMTYCRVVANKPRPWRCGFANGFCVSLQRRRAERQQRSKKVGVRYYETHNVKNKNKNKKKTGLEEQRSKHKKYKHKQ